MAASGGWRTRLNQHKIFDILCENTGKHSLSTESKDLLIVKDGELFLWNAYDQSLLTTNLKNLVANPVENQHSLQHDVDDDRSQFQIFLCSNSPVFEVISIQFNQTGTHLALIGKKGLSVVQIPQRWGKYGEFEGGKEQILAKTVTIGERFFLSSNEKIHHAMWHPGSPTDSHLVVLTSDGFIRIYSLDDPEKPEQAFPVCRAANTDITTTTTSQLSTRVALGDWAVAFDFGPPIQLRKKVAELGPRINNDNIQVSNFAWPIYILWGNGEIYLLMTKLNKPQTLKCGIQGPLSMYPPAEDNYGTDACSIQCLQSRPPVLAVATSEGILYHCVVLNKSEEEDDTQSTASLREEETDILYYPIPDPSLFVYESVELELSLKTVSVGNEELIEDDYGCPIRLHRDPSMSDRYHCSHSAGVHSLLLPWIHKFEHFCDDDNKSVELPTLSTEQQAVVEHVICTKPLPTSVASPVLGLTLVSDRLLGSTLICLTSKPECIALPLLHNVGSAPPPLLSTSPLKMIRSPMKRQQREPFDLHIQRILQRSVSNPILKTSSNTSMTPQECFQLLSRATQVFREQYIQKQEQAQDEIQRRVRVLKEQKRQQISDIAECQHVKNILTEKAGCLAERYEEAFEKQMSIVTRLENILKKVQSRLPVLSDAERNMQKELKEISANLSENKVKIKQLRVKHQYQERQISVSQKAEAVSHSNFSKSQTQHLRTVLKEEGKEIANLVKTVSQLKFSIDV